MGYIAGRAFLPATCHPEPPAGHLLSSVYPIGGRVRELLRCRSSVSQREPIWALVGK